MEGQEFKKFLRRKQERKVSKHQGLVDEPKLTLYRVKCRMHEILGL